MYKATKFEALLWHPKDGVRKVSVSLVAGAEPFSPDPSRIGVQFQMYDPEDDSKVVAVLFLHRDEAHRLATSTDLRTHSGVADAFRVEINKVRERE